MDGSKDTAFIHLQVQQTTCMCDRLVEIEVKAREVGYQARVNLGV